MNETTTIGTTAAATELAVIAPELIVIDGKIATTSLQVGQHFNKQHGHVLRDIRKLECSAEFRLSNFGESYFLNEQGKQQPMFNITKDGFMFLAMGFTGKEAAQWKESYIAEFNRREAELIEPKHPALPSVITPAQAQHLRELVQLVVESGKQGHGETWNRLHRKMKVNSYLMLRPDQFNAAVEYLHGKFDDTSLAAIAAKHFPQLAQLPAPPMKNPEAPTLPFSLDTLVQFLSSGLTEKSALLKVATTSGMALYINVWNEAKDTGWGQQVANQIDGTLPQADLNIIVTKAVQELWTRNLSQTEAGRPVPQRVTH